jgi:hypothetical protein
MIPRHTKLPLEVVFVSSRSSHWPCSYLAHVVFPGMTPGELEEALDVMGRDSLACVAGCVRKGVKGRSEGARGRRLTVFSASRLVLVCV